METEIITVIVQDTEGKQFKREWKATADKRDAIRWTIESADLPYYIDENAITKVTIQTSMQRSST